MIINEDYINMQVCVYIDNKDIYTGERNEPKSTPKAVAVRINNYAMKPPQTIIFKIKNWRGIVYEQKIVNSKND